MEENSFRLLRLAGIETFDPSWRERRALARSHCLGAALLWLAFLVGLVTLGGMAAPPGSQLSYPERWERAIRFGLPWGVTGLGVALVLGWAAYSTALRNYRAAQLVAVLQVGVDRVRCALPVSARLYDPGAKLSPVLVCTAEEILEVPAREPLEEPQLAALCAWADLESVRCCPVSRNLILNHVQGRRYELCFRTASGEFRWHLKPLYSPEAVTRWFVAQGVPAWIGGEPDTRWPEGPQPSGRA